MNIGIYIYNEAEVLDFSGPFEVFSTASRICENDNPFTTFLVSEDGKTINARGGYSINPAYGFQDAPKLDVLIVVGGVHTQEIKKTNVLDWVRQKSSNATAIASVCTGVFLLAEAGVVTNHAVTTHWEDIPDLKANYPNLKIAKSKRWVIDENIITSAGISAGIDMSLYLVSILYSKMLAEKTAKQMEYRWVKN
jgi:transcriptional regulator GlxA family with amidase domain